MNPIDFIFHFDKYLGAFISDYGILTYIILFAIIFCETGLVVTPFLPGDSLLFIAGAFAAQGSLNIFILFFLLFIAAVLGDSLNYWIGDYFGEKVFAKSRFFKKEYLEKTNRFYEKHGAKTILLARFVPIARTFAPFIAGVGTMHYTTFLFYNIFGALIWTGLFLFAGFFFGNIPIVEQNLTIVIFIIIFLSILPGIIEYLRNKKKRPDQESNLDIRKESSFRDYRSTIVPSGQN